MKAIDLLKRDIVKYIYDQDWPALRPIQEAAIKHANDTDNNLILAAPTASGKTEAAFIPAINNVDDWAQGVKIVYISPLIALINDQFKRVTELCEYLDIPVTSWHGESSRNKKGKLLKNPRGILLITPESIEAMLVRKPGEATSLFSKVEWVIIDELHSFLETTRGNHLKSLLGRIAALNRQPPRYIGMTATLNRQSYTIAKQYFSTQRDTSVLLDSSRNELTTTIMYEPASSAKLPAEIIDDIFNFSNNESMLVFPNTRDRVEEIAVGLKRRSKKSKNNVHYFAHHASIDKNLRLESEEFAKTSTYHLFTICCTSTLELGIDIGSVDSVVQVEAAPSVASLAQRLGRSGRIKRHSILHLYSSKDWSLLQNIATLELYKTGIIEEIAPIVKPYGVLIQQILSILIQFSGLNRAVLLDKVIYLDSWGDISINNINKVVDHLLEIDYIEEVDGIFITGISAEHTIESRYFYTHFKSKIEFTVVSDHNHIGQIPLNVETVIGANIFLAARIWKIQDIDITSKKIYVTPAQDGRPPRFGGDASEVSHLLRRKMLSLLQNVDDLENKYAEQVLNVLRKLAKDNLTENHQDFLITSKTSDLQKLTTFAGTKINRTILLLLRIVAGENGKDAELKDSSTSITFPNLTNYLIKLKNQPLQTGDVAKWLATNDDDLTVLIMGDKYLSLLPKELQIDCLISNYFNVDITNSLIQECAIN